MYFIYYNPNLCIWTCDVDDIYAPRPNALHNTLFQGQMVSPKGHLFRNAESSSCALHCSSACRKKYLRIFLNPILAILEIDCYRLALLSLCTIKVPFHSVCIRQIEWNAIFPFPLFRFHPQYPKGYAQKKGIAKNFLRYHFSVRYLKGLTRDNLSLFSWPP